MRNLILIIFICMTTAVWANEDIPEAKETQMVQMDSNQNQKEYKTKKFTVKEETDVVQKALKVFRKKAKGSSYYQKKVWIYDTLEEDNASFLSFMTNDQNQGIVFSPDEDFVYYIETSPGGKRLLKGVKIDTPQRFVIGTNVDDFFIETCEDQNKSYLVVLDDREIEGYYVYDLAGQRITLPDMPADVNDLNSFICY